ncbi:hypothetical protein Y017_13505 [Alcanivorax sp. 97CO-5]|nr:hypothetical protein Y017_13505 [Alcanivorax sp. 97CO-5]
MYAEERLKSELRKEAVEKSDKPCQRRELSKAAVG